MKSIDDKIIELKREILALEKEKLYIKQQNSEKRSKAYNNKKEKLQESANWVKRNLKVGDIVKVIGSRSGLYRKVLVLNQYDIIGLCLTFKNKTFIDDSQMQITNQGYNKITHIFDEKTNKFISVFDLMEKDNGNFA